MPADPRTNLIGYQGAEKTRASKAVVRFLT
jgi:hypothetical protein